MFIERWKSAKVPSQARFQGFDSIPNHGVCLTFNNTSQSLEVSERVVCELRAFFNLHFVRKADVHFELILIVVSE